MSGYVTAAEHLRRKVVEDKFLKFLVDAESWENRAYPDSSGFWTIGVGHRLTQSELSSGKISINGEVVKWSDGLTDKQVRGLLEQDLERFRLIVDVLRQQAPVGLNQDQRDALVSFVFNIGAVAFRRSTLWKRVVAGDLGDVPRQMRRWVYSAGKKWDGLKNRREKEIKYWLGEI